jgi:phage gp36-like protein
MYLTAQEFTERLTALGAITGGEHKRTLVARALEQAHAALDAELGKRYEVPIPIRTRPHTPSSCSSAGRSTSGCASCWGFRAFP